jgi:hypothetical protein
MRILIFDGCVPKIAIAVITQEGDPFIGEICNVLNQTSDYIEVRSKTCDWLIDRVANELTHRTRASLYGSHSRL